MAILISTGPNCKECDLDELRCNWVVVSYQEDRRFHRDPGEGCPGRKFWRLVDLEKEVDRGDD